MTLKGDSGSLLLDKKEKSAIGLAFAGNESSTSFFNKLSLIFNEKIYTCNGYEMPLIKFQKFI